MPKRVPRRPKRAPGWPKRAPAEPRDAPGQSDMVQRAPKIPQNGFQQAPNGHPTGQSPKSPRRPTRSITRPCVRAFCVTFLSCLDVLSKTFSDRPGGQSGVSRSCPVERTKQPYAKRARARQLASARATPNALAGGQEAPNARQDRQRRRAKCAPGGKGEEEDDDDVYFSQGAQANQFSFNMFLFCVTGVFYKIEHERSPTYRVCHCCHESFHGLEVGVHKFM